MYMNKQLGIGGGIIVLIFVLGFLLFRPGPAAPPKTQEQMPALPGTVVTLTSEGFSPAELTVKVGETVTFRTENGKTFWPASNPHPSHTIYPEFDPKAPVPANGSWSMTPTRVGDWLYHDHLAPYYTGTIHVTE
jgi:hypothetical protein